ncbi:MAG TPA: hypothetical protein VH394_26370 [Thermoanaerobaculia bacterium]|jgi:hypothetical protein|nr:hypothetical protein [Thermoanaerobaculia bacterium]
MSFKVKDLSVSLSVDGASTCTGLTKPTGGDTLWFRRDASAKRNLESLKTQLRNAMTRA